MTTVHWLKRCQNDNRRYVEDAHWIEHEHLNCHGFARKFMEDAQDAHRFFWTSSNSSIFIDL